MKIALIDVKMNDVKIFKKWWGGASFTPGAMSVPDSRVGNRHMCP